RLAGNLNRLPVTEPHLLIATNCPMILDLRSDETLRPPLVGEHDPAKKFPQYRRSRALAKELDLADEQGHASGAVVRPEVPRVVRIVRDAIALNIANRPRTSVDYKGMGRFPAEDSWSVLRNDCIERGQRVPPFANMRRVHPSMHERQIAQLDRTKVETPPADDHRTSVKSELIGAFNGRVWHHHDGEVCMRNDVHLTPTARFRGSDQVRSHSGIRPCTN